MAAAKGELNPKPFNEPKNVGVHVVMCSGGYPSIDGSALDTGHAINMPSGLNDNANLFTAGVKLSDGKLVNSGGRVLGVSAVKDSLNGARECAYQFIEQISFKGAHYRRDIGE
jgi:phosphoribosylamine--glycine ligase